MTWPQTIIFLFVTLAGVFLTNWLSLVLGAPDVVRIAVVAIIAIIAVVVQWRLGSER